MVSEDSKVAGTGMPTKGMSLRVGAATNLTEARLGLIWIVEHLPAGESEEDNV